jgi:hypothetical protein
MIALTEIPHLYSSGFSRYNLGEKSASQFTAIAGPIPGRDQKFLFLRNVHTGCGIRLAIYLHSGFHEHIS